MNGKLVRLPDGMTGTVVDTQGATLFVWIELVDRVIIRTAKLWDIRFIIP